MQIIVLSMHRSGSSMVTRLINLMGAYFGPEGTSTGANDENPRGFWERKDIRKLNDEVLFSCHADWYRLSHWDTGRIPDKTLKKFNTEASRIILDMDAHRPWVAKEPRFCILFSLWRRLLEVPVCVHVYRSPLEVARSLKTRNGFPLPFGIALWEYYVLSALKSSRRLPRILVSHEALMTEPVNTTRKLYNQLLDFGVQGLRMPSEREISAFIDPGLWREKQDPERREKDLLTSFQQQLTEAYESGTIFRFFPLPDIDPQTIRILKRHEQEAELKKKYKITPADLSEDMDMSVALHLEIIRRQQQKMKDLLETSP